MLKKLVGGAILPPGTYRVKEMVEESVDNDDEENDDDEFTIQWDDNQWKTIVDDVNERDEQM